MIWVAFNDLGIPGSHLGSLTVTSVIWGSSFPFIRLAVERVPPSAVVFGRAFLPC